MLGGVEIVPSLLPPFYQCTVPWPASRHDPSHGFLQVLVSHINSGNRNPAPLMFMQALLTLALCEAGSVACQIPSKLGILGEHFLDAISHEEATQFLQRKMRQLDLVPVFPGSKFLFQPQAHSTSLLCNATSESTTRCSLEVQQGRIRYYVKVCFLLASYGIDTTMK